MRRTSDTRSPAEQIGAAGERLLEEPLLLAGFAENHVQHRAVTRMVHRLDARAPALDELLRPGRVVTEQHGGALLPVGQPGDERLRLLRNRAAAVGDRFREPGELYLFA